MEYKPENLLVVRLERHLTGLPYHCFGSSFTTVTVFFITDFTFVFMLVLFFNFFYEIICISAYNLDW